MRPSRPAMLASLPLHADPLCIRALTREDLDTLAAWPAYPWPYEGFALRFGTMNPAQLDELIAARSADAHRITLVADHLDQPCVGYLGLVQIDWHKGFVANMGYRIHPNWCDRGLGTRMMQAVGQWFLSHGFQTLRLDVVAANSRAIRCYEKAGFVKTGEFWQEDPPAGKIDLSEPRYDFLRPHVRVEGSTSFLRFYWMELRRQQTSRHREQETRSNRTTG